MPGTSTKTPPTRTTPEERARLVENVVRTYESGLSVKKTAAEFGRSYGWAHRILDNANVLRRRGRRTPAAPGPGVAA